MTVILPSCNQLGPGSLVGNRANSGEEGGTGEGTMEPGDTPLMMSIHPPVINL